MESYVKNVNIPHPSSDGTSILVHLQNPSVTSAPRQQYTSDPESHPRQPFLDDRVEFTNNSSIETNHAQSEPSNNGSATATQDTSNAGISSQIFPGSTSNQETGANAQQTESAAVIPSITTTQSTASGITGSEGPNSANSSSPAENSAGIGAAEPTSEASSDYDWDAGNRTLGFSSATISTDEGMHLANEFSSDLQSDSSQGSDQAEDLSDNQSAGNDETLRDGQDETSWGDDSETLRDDDIETPSDNNNKTQRDDNNETPKDDNNKTPSDDDNETLEDEVNKSLTYDSNETPSHDDNKIPSPNAKDIRVSSTVRLRKTVSGKASENESRSSGNDISSSVGKKWEKPDLSKSHESESES